MSKPRSAVSGRAIVCGFFSVILFLSCSLAMKAQSTYGTLTGTVTDMSGAAGTGYRRYWALFIREPQSRRVSSGG